MAVTKYWDGSQWVPILHGPTFNGGTVTSPITISGVADLNVDSTAEVRDPAVNVKAKTNYAPSVVFWTGGARRHLVGTSADKFRVYDYTAGNLLTQKTAGQNTLVFAAPPEVPAATAAGQAAQVSAKDATTGRLAIGGMEMGDTGWRSIASEMNAAIWSNQFGVHVRRVGKIVMVKFVDNTVVNPLPLTWNNLWAVPTGFRPSDYYAPMIFGVVGSTETSGGNVRITPSYDGEAPWTIRFHASMQGKRLSGEATFITDNAWPTSLPGTQITAPLS